MGDFKGTREMLTHAANKAENVGEGIAGNLTLLLGSIQDSYAGFKGGAGSTFQTTSGELGEELQKLLVALNTMANHVNKGVVDYGSTDEDAAAEIKSVGQGYGGDANVINALMS